MKVSLASTFTYVTTPLTITIEANATLMEVIFVTAVFASFLKSIVPVLQLACMINQVCNNAEWGFLHSQLSDGPMTMLIDVWLHTFST